MCHPFSNMSHNGEYSQKSVQDIQQIRTLQSPHQPQAIYANINAEIVLTKLHIDSKVPSIFKPSFIVNIYEIWMGQQTIDRCRLIFNVLIRDRVKYTKQLPRKKLGVSMLSLDERILVYGNDLWHITFWFLWSYISYQIYFSRVIPGELHRSHQFLLASHGEYFHRLHWCRYSQESKKSLYSWLKEKIDT